jgi:hypothetical protein
LTVKPDTRLPLCNEFQKQSPLWSEATTRCTQRPLNLHVIFTHKYIQQEHHRGARDHTVIYLSVFAPARQIIKHRPLSPRPYMKTWEIYGTCQNYTQSETRALTIKKYDHHATFWQLLYKTPWHQSASELYRPSDRRFSAKLVPNFCG